MNPLKSVETTIANLVEGAFGRIFRSEVRPMELARKLAREMDAHRTTSVSRVYAPNEYSVWLSSQDRARYAGVEDDVIEELCGYLLEHARREQLILSSPPLISFHTDERLRLGEFGIQAQLVRPPGHSEESHGPHPPDGKAGTSHPAPQASGHGETMIYSTAARVLGPLVLFREARRAGARLAIGDRRLQLPAEGGTIGRSRDCDVVLADVGVSRRHADIRPSPSGWTITDLGSTNGVLLNGRPVGGMQPLRPGDRVELGSTEIVFEGG